MADSVAAVVLGAGAGTRLRPLSTLRPKVLCPVNGVPLVDLAIDRARAVADDVAVNVHHGRDALVAHLDGRVHVSIEDGDEALGTAGGVGHLRGWLDGRAAFVLNGDTWSPVDLAPHVADWDGERVRVLVTGEDAVLGPSSGIAASLLPPSVVATLPDSPAGLYEVCWKPALDAGRLEVVAAGGPFIPVDRPADYLAANLAASGGDSVIGEGAVVDGEIIRCVLWPGAVVRRGEVLVDAIRCDARTTVLVRGRSG
jgi:NDP-sugar pyrophosphorylase family protein